MKVLLTGASGYIGRYLVDGLIEHGHEVKALTRQSSLKIKDVEIVCGDILKPESLLFALDEVDAVLHNAAYAVDLGVKKQMHASTYSSPEKTKLIGKLLHFRAENGI